MVGMAGFEPAASASRTLHSRILTNNNNELRQVREEVRPLANNHECQRARDRCGMRYAYFRRSRARYRLEFLRHFARGPLHRSQYSRFGGVTNLCRHSAQRVGMFCLVTAVAAARAIALKNPVVLNVHEGSSDSVPRSSHRSSGTSRPCDRSLFTQKASWRLSAHEGTAH